MQIFLICVYFLVYYFFTRVFHTCFSHGICVQYGGFPRMKPMCNAAMPRTCTVDSEYDYCTCKKNALVTVRNRGLHSPDDHISPTLSWVHYSKPKATIISINVPAVHTWSHGNKKNIHTKRRKAWKTSRPRGDCPLEKKPLLNCSTKCSKLRLRHSKY